MAEQFLRGYSINFDDLYAVVGSKNAKIIKQAKRKDVFEELNELLEEFDGLTLEEAILDIVTGNLKQKEAYSYRRALEVLLEVKGKQLSDEADLPGRGWQEEGIKNYLIGIGLPTLGELWCSDKVPFSFPWKKINSDSVDWPIAMLIHKSSITRLNEEFDAFDFKILNNNALPKRQKGCEEEFEYLLKMLKKWMKRTNKDIVLLLDGQQ